MRARVRERDALKKRCLKAKLRASRQKAESSALAACVSTSVLNACERDLSDSDSPARKCEMRVEESD